MLACDASEQAPAFKEADRAFIVPSSDDPGYFDVLLAICEVHQVRLIVSVNDLELSGLAHHAQRFHRVGTIPLVSASRIIAQCQDKWASYHWLVASGLPTPKTFLRLDDARRAVAVGDLAFPLLIKPRWGTTSMGIEQADNDRELDWAYQWAQMQTTRSVLAKLRQGPPAEALIIQEYIHGQEYGLDVVNDLEGRYAGNPQTAQTHDARWEYRSRSHGQGRAARTPWPTTWRAIGTHWHSGL